MRGLTIETPATILDVAELSGAISPLMWAVAREMWANGQTWAIRVDDELVGIAGIYPLQPEIGECWFNVKPQAARHMLAIVRAIRLTIRESRYREIVVACDTPAGVRIARSAGFSFHAATQNGEVWTCSFSEAATAPQRTSSSSSSAAT
jgi:hypothetical protein